MKLEFYFRYFCYSLALSLVLSAISCGRLSQRTAHQTFLEENPNYLIVSSETGEGWDGVAYHHFKYKKPNDEKNYEEVWCFVQQEDGNWKVTSRETPKK